MAPSPRDQKAPRPLPLLARSRGRAMAALVAPVSSGAPTLAACRDRDEGARARLHRGLRAAMHALRGRVRRVGVAPAMLAARRFQFRSHRSVGNHGAGGVTGHHAGVLGFRVDCRGRRVVSDVRRESAVVAVPAPRHLAVRLWPNGEQARRLVRQRRSGSALGRSSSSEGAPRPQARAPRSRGGPGRRRGTFAVAVAKKPASAEEPGTPEARRADAPPEENAGAANAPRVEAGEAA